MTNSTASVIPAFALKRIREGSGATDAAAVFTSDFSVNEFVLVRKAGFQPVGLCMGSCVYHVGIQYGNWIPTKSSRYCRRRCTTRASWP